MHACILHECNYRQLRNLNSITIIIYIKLKLQFISKSILLKIEISNHEFHLIPQRNRIRLPADICPFHRSKMFHHFCGLFFIFNNTVHSDAFKRIKKEMRINLTMKCKKFCIFTCNITFLCLKCIDIDRLNQFIHPVCHYIIIRHQAVNLIISIINLNLFQTLQFRIIKCLLKHINPSCNRMVHQNNHSKGKKDIKENHYSNYKSCILPKSPDLITTPEIYCISCSQIIKIILIFII